MGVARTTVRVTEQVELRPRPFIAESGDACAWLELGDGSEVGLYGPPAAMRRLGAAVIAAAAAADELPDPARQADAAALKVVAAS
jgi:hypothetical protein